VDSISQFALGAAIGELTLGRRLGRKAIVVGGLIGTLPDLDVLVHYTDAVASYTYHRSWSHSLVVLGLVSPFFAWLLHLGFPRRWVSGIELSHPGSQPGYANWFWCVFLVLTTHPVLDGFTLYGTQLFWPFPAKPIAWGSIFIIDPLYTLPLIIGLVVGYRNRKVVRRAVLIGVLVSSAYLGFTLLVQQHVRFIGVQSLQDQQLGSGSVLVAPLPFSVLWRVVSVDGEHYHEGFYSLLDQHKHIRFASFESNRHVIEEQIVHWPISRLDWFANGMISASRKGDELIINDLRMGVEASYVFRFLVGRWNDSNFVPLESKQLPMQFDKARMRSILQRAWDEQVNVEP